MGLNMENIFSVQTWEYLKPDYLFQTIGNGSGTFSQMDKLGMAQVSSNTEDTTGSNTYVAMDDMTITASFNEGDSAIINFSGNLDQTGTVTGLVYCIIYKDGVAIASTETYSTGHITEDHDHIIYHNINIHYIDVNVSAGTHNYKVYWKQHVANPPNDLTSRCPNRIFNIIKTKPIDE